MFRKKLLNQGLLIWCFLKVFSCQSTQVVMKSTRENISVDVRAINLASPESPEEKLGALPLELNMNSLGNKVLRLHSPGYATQYWFFPEFSKSEFSEIMVALEPKIDAGDGNAAPTTLANLDKNEVNKMIRLIMNGYQSLAKKEYDQALEYASQAKEINNLIAGPYLLEGLVLLEQGERQRAEPILKQARERDPEDQDLLRLINYAQSNP